MGERPIQGLMKTAMENLRDMVDVNTVVGDAIETPHGEVIVPVSRVSFGFAAGGGEYETRAATGAGETELPFGGGSGGGVSIQPVGFLVVGKENVRFLGVNNQTTVERLMDMAPELIGEIRQLWGGDRAGADGQAHRAATAGAPLRGEVHGVTPAGEYASVPPAEGVSGEGAHTHSAPDRHERWRRRPRV